MRYYKVTLQKIAFVRANNKAEAEEFALDDDCITSVEEVVDVKQSNRREMIEIMMEEQT